MIAMQRRMLASKKLFITKKSEALPTIVFFLAGIALFLVLLGIHYKIAKTSQEVETQSICYDSVALHARMHVKGLDMSSEINCPTMDVTIKKSKEVSEEKRILQTETELAELLRTCWYQFHEGKLKLFDENLMRTDTYCVICHHIEFEDKELQIKAQDFVNYLQDKDIEIMDDKGKKQKISYLEYLQRSSIKEIKWSGAEVGDYGINTNIDYATIFVYAKDGTLNSYFMKAAGIGGVGFGLVAGTVAAIGAIPVTAGIVIAGIAGTITGGTFAFYNGGVDQEWDSGAVLYPYSEYTLRDIQCTEMPSRQAQSQK